MSRQVCLRDVERAVLNGMREELPKLKAQRLQVETELAALEDAPSIITLHPAMLDQYIRTVDALAAALADHAGAEDGRGSLVGNFSRIRLPKASETY
jgi:hypothetical protein